MSGYELTKDAENDLRAVARYTLKEWGKEALTQYRKGLKAIFQKIGNDTVIKKQFSEKHPQLFVAKYKYHYIFYLTNKFEKPIIIGVIHEKRDIVNHLKKRL